MTCDTRDTVVCVGMAHEHVFRVTKDDIATLQKITGDTHRIHAGKKAVAQGALEWAFVGRALTDMLGDKYIPRSQHGEFLHSLRPNREAKIQLEVSDIDTTGTVHVLCLVTYVDNPKLVLLNGSVSAYKARSIRM